MARRKLYDVVLIVQPRDHTIGELASTIVHVLGFEASQAYNCALILHSRGRYVVKTFKHSELKLAKLVIKAFTDSGILAQLQQQR